MKKLHIKKDDTVIVISGDDKGAKGKVLRTSPEEGKVLVSGINMVSKHQKPRKQGDAGGIIKAEGALYASKVQLFCDKCNKGVRTKAVIKDGKKTRVCSKCGKEL